MKTKQIEPKEKCKTCWGFGLWAIGDPSPMGPMDASGGMPTIACPECGANLNSLTTPGRQEGKKNKI